MVFSFAASLTDSRAGTSLRGLDCGCKYFLIYLLASIFSPLNLWVQILHFIGIKTIFLKKWKPLNLLHPHKRCPCGVTGVSSQNFSFMQIYDTIIPKNKARNILYKPYVALLVLKSEQCRHG